jgi:hypothetical protein
MQFLDRGLVELKQRLAPGANDESAFPPLTTRLSPPANRLWPLASRFLLLASRFPPSPTPAPIDCLCKLIRALESATIWSNADEIGVAELADRSRAIVLSARPKVAPGEATKNCRAASLRALTLKRVKDLLHSIGHGATPALRDVV